MSFANGDYLDRLAYGESAIHRLDPRAKLLASMAFILLVVSFPKYEVASLIPYAVFPVTVAILAFIPAWELVKRVLIALPFVVMVGIFNPFLDRAPGMEIMGIVLNRGTISFASIVVRGLLCVSAAVLLMATTSFPLLIEALRAFRAPRALTVQLTMMYRYLFLLIGEARRMRRAHALRSGSDKVSIREAGAILSALLTRALDRAGAVYLAMRARGFDGDMPGLTSMRWKRADTAFVAAVAAVSAALRVFPLAETLGRLLGWS